MTKLTLHNIETIDINTLSAAELLQASYICKQEAVRCNDSREVVIRGEYNFVGKQAAYYMSLSNYYQNELLMRQNIRILDLLNKKIDGK